VSGYRQFYEGNHLYSVDAQGEVHKARGRAGSVNSERCPDCDLRDALNHMGLPNYCGDCRETPVRGKRRCAHKWCANGCEVCGGTGRVSR
jgi:hypothetical protein